MNIYKYPNKESWESLAKRPVLEKSDLRNVISEVFQNVKENGDEALKFYTKKFDDTHLETFLVSENEVIEALNSLDDELKKAIQVAKQNIEKFHQSQAEKSEKIETVEGVICWRESRPIEKVGIYIPGGTAPLFSTVLMLAIPAHIAGCKEIILCSPPNKNGQLNSAILYAAKLCGVTKIFKVGGSQAIAAMTFGTESIPKAYKIFGPGNQFVTAAKEFSTEFGVAIDMPAGPSEVLVMADERAIPEFCAADLLSQAEHGSDSQVIFLATAENVFNETIYELEKQIKLLPRNEFTEKSISNSRFILLNSIEECLEFSNLYAPEHLILAIENPENQISKIINAGSVFLGNYSCESAGDYASGTNHTLPTNSFARNYSGVSLDSFVKKVTFQNLSEKGIQNLGKTIELMAEAEGLFAHKNAVTLRLNKLKNEKL
ncbi:histidinol dehydrogenase [Candidatus Kaistella beijingensis]|uniref:histidinol dehydrogenase n=1 Tax=Candidatus Kaistella beijingensis TaxID=2820270 RepID=UPI001CC5F2F5|nr:histidinol dehydrogenase [Candidatus Kaistella beijingensis]UBB90644.1 histidinol dehydrogenase [Candidatus Kaistella beijingensis]